MPGGIPAIGYKQPTESDPIPFDVDSYVSSAYKDIPIEEVPTKIGAFAESMRQISRPFFAQGFNSIATLNRGTAAFYSHLDSIADYIEKSSGMKSGNLFEDLATIASNDSERWAKAAEEVGITFIDEMVSEAVGGFVPGVTQFALDVGSGYTFPYMAGAAEAEEGESPFAAGMVAAAKTATLDKLFRMMHPLKTYLKAPAFGTVFGLEEAAVAPEGQKAKAFAKGAGIGAMYAMTSPGGKLGLNEVKEATRLALDNLERTPAGQFAIRKLSEERGSTSETEVIVAAGIKLKDGRVFEAETHHLAMEKMDEAGIGVRDWKKVVEDADVFVTNTGRTITREEAVRLTGEKSEDAMDIVGHEIPGGGFVADRTKRKRKFLKSMDEAREIDPTVKEKVKEIDPQDYFVEPNAEAIEIAKQRIEKEGITKANEYLESDAPPGSEKGAAFYVMIKDSQRRGDYEREVELIELADVQLREAGRFIQSASLWSNMGSPAGFIKWANKQLRSVENKYNFTDTIMKRKPEEFSLNKEEQKIVIDTFREIDKMTDATDRADATLELIDMVALKVPPSVSEMIDAYRYTNMLSSPKTQMRNIGENTGNTFLTRPIDIATKGAIDYIISAKSGKDRKAYVNDVPVYYKAAWNAIPNAARAFSDVMRMSKDVQFGKPDIGIESRTEFERARAKQLPAGLTLVGRFMEASDKFNSAIIGAGEMATQIKRGVPESEAYANSQEIAQNYLYRDKQDPNSLSVFSKGLSSLGSMLEYSRTKPVLGQLSKWYIPFLRTPINKAISMVEHSPMGLIRTPSGFTQENSAKALAGSIAMAVGATAAYMGETTWAPPTNQDEKELFYASGRRPYSIKIPLAGVGETWVPFWYFGPWAAAIALPAATKYFTEDENKAITKNGLEKLGEITTGMAQFVGSQSSTQSMGTLFAALHGDIDRTFSSQTGFTAQQMIPAGGLIRYVNTIIDPVYRKPKGFLEGMYANIPVLSKNLEAYLEPTGKLATRETANYFLPYDLGFADKGYEQGYRIKQDELRQKAIESKINKISRDLDSGRITLKESQKRMFELNKKPQQSTLKYLKDLKK